MTTDDPQQCQAIAFYGSRNPDSPAFGPDDPCDRDALPGSDYCGEHQGWDR